MKYGNGVRKFCCSFEYVHSDICGSKKLKSHGSGLYFLIIIDNFSKRIGVHILKNESDTFAKLKECHTLIGSQLGYKLNMLRNDSGMKFVLNEFNEF